MQTMVCSGLQWRVCTWYPSGYFQDKFLLTPAIFISNTTVERFFVVHLVGTSLVGMHRYDILDNTWHIMAWSTIRLPKINCTFVFIPDAVIKCGLSWISLKLNTSVFFSSPGCLLCSSPPGSQWSNHCWWNSRKNGKTSRYSLVRTKHCIGQLMRTMDQLIYYQKNNGLARQQ